MQSDSAAVSEEARLSQASVAGGIAPVDQAVTQLERQVERGSFFTHTVLGENRVRLNEVESFIYGLVDALVAKGVVSPKEVGAATQNVREQLMDKESGVGVALRVEPPDIAERPPVSVDCAGRMHICKAVCCKLDFALTVPEVEAGTVRWDLGRPYFIRHEADGHCTHVNRETGGCNVYANRPGVCRGYSCANDKRIWKDFENMELNEEWLAQNLSETRPRALRVLMQENQFGAHYSSSESPEKQDAEQAFE